MDLRLYARVLWRFRVIVTVGFIVATGLAILSLVKVSPDGFTYRQSQLWSTEMRLLVTQRGFPEGRLYAESPAQPGQVTPDARGGGAPIADPARFNTLAILYSELATSDPVRRLMLNDRRVPGKILATPLRDDQSGVLLPLIQLVAISSSPQAAIELALRSARALNTFISEQQRANNVPESDRVIVQTIVQPRQVNLFQPRSKTMSFVVFFVAMFATVGLAFLLENTRPRRPELSGTTSDIRGAEQRRTA